MAQSHQDFYTVPEAAEALGVSVSTIRRWIADRRLPAFRLGPKALRIRKQDVETASRPAPPADSRPMMRVVTNLSEIGPMTDETRLQWMAAIDAMDAFREELLAKRGGKLFSDSTEIIRSEREKRTRHLETISRGSAKYRASQRANRDAGR